MQKKALLRKLIEKQKVDGILVTDLTNVRYLTGFRGSSGYAIISEKHALFVTDFRYQEQADNEVKGFTVKIEHTEKSREVKNLCGALGIKRLGFEEHHMSFGYYKKLIRRSLRLKPLGDAVESLRIIKSASELTCIQASVRRAEKAFRALMPFVKTGTTERKLALKFEELLKHNGCKNLPFDVIVASGPMSALPHARPTERRLKKGDLVVFDWGGEYEGYYSDMTRTLLLKGSDMARQKELYYCVLEAQKQALETVRPGVRAAAVDAGARRYIKERGYDDFFGHGTGHGVGCAVHEKPVISWRSKELIRENMVFTVEPGIYIPGFGGVRIEDMVVVRKHRGELMTSLPKKLKIVEG